MNPDSLEGETFYLNIEFSESERTYFLCLLYTVSNQHFLHARKFHKDHKSLKVVVLSVY